MTTAERQLLAQLVNAVEQAAIDDACYSSIFRELRDIREAFELATTPLTDELPF